MPRLTTRQLVLYKIVAILAILFLIAFLRYSAGISLFFAQNNSIFEIAKVVFWAVIIYGLFEFLIPGFAEQENIFFAKLVGIVIAPILTIILLVFFPLGFTMVFFGITLSIITATAVEQYLATKEPNCAGILVTTFLFLFLFISFIVFTYHPLSGFIFKIRN